MAKNNKKRYSNKPKNHNNHNKKPARVSWFFNLPRKIVFTGIYILAGLLIVGIFFFTTWQVNRVVIPNITFQQQSISPRNTASFNQIERRYGIQIEYEAHIRLVGIDQTLGQANGNARVRARANVTGPTNVSNLQFAIVLGANWVDFNTRASGAHNLGLNNQNWTTAQINNIPDQFPARRFGFIRVNHPTLFVVLSWINTNNDVRHTYVVSLSWRQINHTTW